MSWSKGGKNFRQRLLENYGNVCLQNMRVLKEDKTVDILNIALLISVVGEDRRFPHAV